MPYQPEWEKIMEKSYDIYLEENPDISFDDFYKKVIEDPKFGEYYDKVLWKKAKEKILLNKLKNINLF